MLWERAKIITYDTFKQVLIININHSEERNLVVMKNHVF